ncbi:antibiotic biosynthesis monooxygenase [Sneathiella chungangensis]|uniref:Antibiotic biosynthesis monooxygenase n=1 Tax=Sneathiella chungangensis TaxID=1418234 RepID=A0A845MEI9_9PROT|nr:putative quinol monooxygenase [Sneathiella chungangensis]MZR22388.1 antibiotic biosynthesis monooxygenase [Sneathiella chungangensis]
MTTSRLAVTARFDIIPGKEAAFMKEMKKQAENSLSLEPDCHYFDICVDVDNPGRIILYELYEDAAAFEEHLASRHFAEFVETITPMITAKEIERWNRV